MRTIGTGFGQYPWLRKGHPAAGSSGSRAYFGCHGTDDQLWYATNPGLGWSAAIAAGGFLIDGPGVAPTGSNATFFVEGNDQGVWERVVAPGGPVSGLFGDGGGARFGAGAA